MIFTITERNFWENESWTYLLDTEKQDADTMNWLMIFIRIANEVCKDAADSAPVQNFGGPFSRPMKIFAASRYSLQFYDEIVEDNEKETRIMRRVGKQKTHTTVRKTGDYKSGGNFTDRKLSFAKIKSAAVTIRDKKENKLYKDLESAFHSKKLQTSTQQ